MSQQRHIQALFVRSASELFPDLIREDLISDANFRREHGLKLDAVLLFGPGGPSFRRSALLNTIRRSFASDGHVETVDDLAGTAWNVEISKSESAPNVSVVHGQRRFSAAHLVLLASDRDIRLAAFRAEAAQVNLPQHAREKWEALLDSHCPDDDELSDIQDDLNLTPASVGHTIQRSLSGGSASLGAIVPASETYYERLVGRVEDGQSFEQFVATSAASHVEVLIKWDEVKGCRFALEMAGHPSISAALGQHAISINHLKEVFSELITSGDVMSRAAAIELGLNRAKTSAELKPLLGQLITAAVMSAPVAKIDPYVLLSSIFILTYGEISYTRCLASKPPYWRRLAAIAQAIMIVRIIALVEGDATGFVDWAKSVRSQVFLLQCFADLRMEPRWVAELILCGQLKNEIGGRIWSAAAASREIVNEAGWAAVLLDETESSLKHQLQFPHVFLPGPLEGGSSSGWELPTERLDGIRTALAGTPTTASSFSAVANAALLFKIPLEISGLAASAIARSGYYLEGADDRTRVPIILGLGTVAAVTRSSELADAIFAIAELYAVFSR